MLADSRRPVGKVKSVVLTDQGLAESVRLFRELFDECQDGDAPPLGGTPNAYEKGIKVSDDEMASLNVKPDPFHGEWNYYTIAQRRPDMTVIWAQALSRMNRNQ